jgi:hypothetical protein
MDSDNERPSPTEQESEKPNLPASESPVLSDEDAKRQAMRKRKPLGPVVKPLSKDEIDRLLGDPEIKERDHLSDALPKGWDEDYQDEF